MTISKNNNVTPPFLPQVLPVYMHRVGQNIYAVRIYTHIRYGYIRTDGYTYRRIYTYGRIYTVRIYGTDICICGVYIQYFWQRNHQIYGHIRCMYTVLANPKHACSSNQATSSSNWFSTYICIRLGSCSCVCVAKAAATVWEKQAH